MGAYYFVIEVEGLGPLELLLKEEMGVIIL